MRTLLLLAHEDPIRLEESDDVAYVQEMLCDYGAMDVTGDETFESAYRNGQDPSMLFDQAPVMLDNLDTMDDPELVAAKERLLSILPYEVPEQRMNNWLMKVYQRDPDRLMWHVNRSCFISGTRVGTFVAGMENIPDQMGKDPSMIVREMLLMLPPQRSIGAMRRGIALEPMIDAMFLSGEWLEGTPLEGSRIEVFNTPAVMLWSDKSIDNGPRYSGNPDRVVNIYPPNGGVLRFVVDYKAPASLDHYRHQNPIGYQLQVDHYRWGLQEHNIPTHGGMVCYLDLANWSLHVVMNPEDQFKNNVQRIQEAGRHYWTNYIAQGLVPDFRPRVEFKPEHNQEKIRELGLAMAYYKACKDVADKQIDYIRNELVDLVEGREFEKCDLGDGMLNMGSKWVDNQDSIIEFLKSHDIVPPMVEVVDTKRSLDIDRARDILLRMGVDPESNEFKNQNLRIAFPRSAKHERALEIKALKTLAMDTLNEVQPNVLKQACASIPDPKNTQDALDNDSSGPKRKKSPAAR